MKTVIFSIIIIVSLSTPIKNEFLPLAIEGKNRVEIVFDRKMSFDDLVNIRRDLKKKGIDLEFKELSFDKYQKLEGISFQVDCNDGFSGASGVSILGRKDFGFFRDYTERVKVPFGVGNIKDLK